MGAPFGLCPGGRSPPGRGGWPRIRRGGGGGTPRTPEFCWALREAHRRPCGRRVSVEPLDSWALNEHNGLIVTTAIEPYKFTEERREVFLKALARLGIIAAACGAAKIARVTVARHRAADAEFEAQVQTALDEHYRDLTETARAAAIDGLVDETYDKDGNLISRRRRISDAVLRAWLRHKETGSWCDRAKVEIEGKVKHEHSGRIEVAKLNDDQRRRARDFLLAMQNEN